jgi:hypothetical protein
MPDMTERRLSASSHAWSLAGLISLAVAIVTLTRLMPYWIGEHHPLQQYLWNFTPVTALLLFGVAMFPRRWVGIAFLLPILAMLISDAVLAVTSYAEMGGVRARTTVYGTFFLIGLLGFWLRKRRGVMDVAAVSVISSLLFFLITNFAIWVGADPHQPPPLGFEKTVVGLLTCYELALPFFKNQIMGDLLYCGFLFGGYALLERWLTARQPVPATVRH